MSKKRPIMLQKLSSLHYLVGSSMTCTTISIFALILLFGTISAAKHPKIIGGDNAEIEDFPYVVSIRYGKHYCGGSIISNRHVLTAAHCMHDVPNKEKVTIHSGTSSTGKEGTVRKILAVQIHPKFDINNNAEGYPHDIAVITLDKPIEFNKFQHKIKLPSHNIQNNQVAYLVGWGRMTRHDQSRGRQLQKLRVDLLSSNKCKPLITHKINPEQFCTFRSSTSGACQGDSGGPLVSHGVLVGIVSYGDTGVCADGVPDIYTNVYAYKDFIQSVISE